MELKDYLDVVGTGAGFGLMESSFDKLTVVTMEVVGQGNVYLHQFAPLILIGVVITYFVYKAKKASKLVKETQAVIQFSTNSSLKQSSLADIEKKLISIKKEHLGADWKLQFGHMETLESLMGMGTINGGTDNKRKVIKLNTDIITRCPFMDFWTDVLLHEIAHALVGNTPDDSTGHGKKWVAMALKLGVEEPSPEPAPRWHRIIEERTADMRKPSQVDMVGQLLRAMMRNGN